MTDTAIFWFRRDLRLHDNAGLYHALKQHRRVQSVFIFDTDILSALPSKQDRRVDFIHQAVQNLAAQLRQHGAQLQVYTGSASAAFAQILRQHQPSAVYTNTDYEPKALARDLAIERLLSAHAVPLHRYKDQLVFDKNEVLKDDGKPYTVFTPYSRKWKKQLNRFYLSSYPVEAYLGNLAPYSGSGSGSGSDSGSSGVGDNAHDGSIPSLAALGFSATGANFSLPSVSAKRLHDYHELRDFPAADGTSRLGPHLRFGTGSIRALARQALAHSDTFLNELIWREFFQMLLWHYPHTVEQAFKPAYDAIAWRNDVQEFARWKAGTTGYPLVDAGMRELAATGHMHNRVRMVVASFLCKHLLVDWRWGEAWFAQLLLDYEQAANVGNWQWAAGCGADAAPYFRVFNPQLQADKFDSNQAYIHRWVPELGKPDYPQPLVEHRFARERCLAVYRQALETSAPTPA